MSAKLFKKVNSSDYINYKKRTAIAEEYARVSNTNPTKSNGNEYNRNFKFLSATTPDISNCLIQAQSYDLKRDYTSGVKYLNGLSCPSIAPSGFTVNVSDFLVWNDSAISEPGVIFIPPGNTVTMLNSYDAYLSAPQGTIMDNISNQFINAGMSQYLNYLWRVQWAPGSTVSSGFVVMRSNFTSYINLTTIDTSSNLWQSGDPNTPVLVGTFYFPATFTPYLPIIQFNTVNWC